MKPSPHIIGFISAILRINCIDFPIGPALRKERSDKKVRKNINYFLSVVRQNVEFVGSGAHGCAGVAPASVGAEILFELVFCRVCFRPEETIFGGKVKVGSIKE